MINCSRCGEFLFHESESQPEKRGVMYHTIDSGDDLTIWCEYCYQDEMAITYGQTQICTSAINIREIPGGSISSHDLCDSENCECSCHFFANQLEILLR